MSSSSIDSICREQEEELSVLPVTHCIVQMVSRPLQNEIFRLHFIADAVRVARVRVHDDVFFYFVCCVFPFFRHMTLSPYLSLYFNHDRRKCVVQ